jgi:hypothetical protein
MMADLAPVGGMETFLASSVAEEAWRLNHARAQCGNIVAIGHFDSTGDTYAAAEHLEVHTAITRYTDRHYRRLATAEANVTYGRKQSRPKELPKAA